MSSPVDPVGTEIEGIHELVYFSDADVLAGGAGMAHDLAIRGRGSHRARHRYEREKIKRAAEAIPPSLRSKLHFSWHICSLALSRRPSPRLQSTFPNPVADPKPAEGAEPFRPEIHKQAISRVCVGIDGAI